MFGSAWIRSLPLLPEDAMDQQHQTRESTRQREPLALPSAERDHWLTTETRGREVFRTLVEDWLKHNGWSLAVTSRLAELALLAQAREPLPDWTAGMPLKAGQWVNHRGHAWEAIGSPVSEPAEDAPGWRDVGLTSRLHASGLNLFLRRKTRGLTSTFFLEIGRLNEWIAAVQRGEREKPEDPRLSDAVAQAVVLSDAEGVLGPEKMLSIAIGRLDAPALPNRPGQTLDTSKAPGVPARKLRKALALADLDPVEDWETIRALYPTKDAERLQRLQQVLHGLHTWTAQEEEDEAVGTVELLKALEALGKGKAEDPAAEAPALPAVDVKAVTVS